MKQYNFLTQNFKKFLSQVGISARNAEIRDPDQKLRKTNEWTLKSESGSTSKKWSNLGSKTRSAQKNKGIPIQIGICVKQRVLIVYVVGDLYCTQFT